MKSSRLAQPGRSPSKGQGQRRPVSSTIDSSPKHSSITSSKRKNVRGPTSSRTSSTSHSRNNPSLLYTKGESEVIGDGISISDVLQIEQVGDFTSLPDCRWPNWSHWRSSEYNDTCSTNPEMPILSDLNSNSSQSGAESLWTTSSSSSGRFQEASQASQQREVGRPFREDCILVEREPRKKLRHRKSFLTKLFNFNPEKKVEVDSGDPILVSVNVLGSPGPLRLLVDKNDSVRDIIDFSIRKYASQRRQPTLADPSPFFGLYCLNPDFQVLDGKTRIGDQQARQFNLYRKQQDDIDLTWCEGSGTAAPIKTWMRESLVGMWSWAASMVASFSKTLTSWVNCWSPCL